MPLWVKLMLLGLGLAFLSVGVGVGVFGARQAQAHVALVEGLRPLSAAGLEDQPVGADALVTGTVSPRNRPVFRDFVAYVSEELDVSTDSDGDRDETWRSSRSETPPLTLEAGGVVTLSDGGYRIEKGHQTWYDEATLGFNRQTRDGSRRYHGLLAGAPITAFGTVVAGPEGNELDAVTLYGGTVEEYLQAQRDSAAFMPIFGAIFGFFGVILLGLSLVFFVRRA